MGFPTDQLTAGVSHLDLAAARFGALGVHRAPVRVTERREGEAQRVRSAIVPEQSMP